VILPRGNLLRTAGASHRLEQPVENPGLSGAGIDHEAALIVSGVSFDE
jgi:hypothetical protein